MLPGLDFRTETLGQLMHRRMPQMPQPLMRGDQTFHIPASRPIRRERTARQHHLKNMKQLFGYLEIRLIARMMEGN